MLNLVFESSNNVVFASGASERTLRVKLQKILKEQTSYKGGWELWVNNVESTKDTLVFDVTNRFAAPSRVSSMLDEIEL